MHFSGNIPAKYDEYLGPVLFEPYALDLKKRLRKYTLQYVLEIACGTGVVTSHLLDILPPSGKITATDINPDMLNMAKKKIKDERVVWSVADAQDLPYSDNAFDTIICQYGVMFFPDKLKAFKEARRVLKNGGVLIFNTWDKIENNPAVEIVNKNVQSEFAEDAPDFLEKGPFSFFDIDTIRALLIDAGFTNIEIETVRLKSAYKNAGDLVKGFIEGSPLAVFLQDKDICKQESVYHKTTQQLTERFGKSSDEIYLQALVCTILK